MTSRSPVRQITRYFSTPLTTVLRDSKSDVHLQNAFYNVAAFSFIFVGLGAAVAVYFVLEAFVKPLLWAVLCGAFLFPLKYTLSKLVCSWLRSLRKSNTPLLVGFAILPFQVLNELSAIIGVFIFRHITELLSLTCTSLALYLLYLYQPFNEIFIIVSGIGMFLYQALGYFSNPLWVWSVVLCYSIIVAFFWTPSYTKIITIFAYPVWSVFILHVASSAGKFKVPLFLFILMLCCIGALAELVKSYKGHKYKLHRDGSKLLRNLSFAAAAVMKNQNSESEDETVKGEKTKDRPKLTKDDHVTTDTVDEKTPNIKASDLFFLALFWATGFVCIAKNLWILELLTVPFVIYVGKKLLVWIDNENALHEYVRTFSAQLKVWAKERKDVLAPAPLRGITRTILLGDKKMVFWVEQFVDKLISICMIFFLILGTIMFAAVIAIQVQRESLHLVQVSGDLVNDAMNEYPEFFKQWAPENQDFHHIIEKAVDQMFFHGRDWLANKVENIGGTTQRNNSQLRKHILELTDRLYQSWKELPEKENSSGSESQSEKMTITTKSNSTVALKRAVPFGLSLRGIYNTLTVKQKIDIWTVLNVVKENIDVLMSVLESVWLIFKSNMNLAFNIITVFLSVVFSSGTYLLNAGFSTIVFLTTLFYLLSFSHDQYLPVHWVSTVSGDEATLFGEIIYTAIRGVFGASLKMAAFYGLYTWLTHTLFGVKIVFIPSAIAAVTGVVPFVASYWAAVPAVLELWLIDNAAIQAVLLVICHILPTYVVDTVIYSEIKGGGHPYLTGLSVAGGIYCLGLEGAIVGPIVLCCLIAAFNVQILIMHGSDEKSQSPEHI